MSPKKSDRGGSSSKRNIRIGVVVDPILMAKLERFCSDYGIVRADSTPIISNGIIALMGIALSDETGKEAVRQAYQAARGYLALEAHTRMHNIIDKMFDDLMPPEVML